MRRRDGAWRFDRLAANYDQAQLPTEQAFIAQARARLLANAHGEVLEIGIGTGASLSDYPGPCQLTGIDISNAMLEICRSKLTGATRRVSLVQAAAESLPFPDGKFDTVTSSLSLCAVKDLRKSATEIRRCLRPGGKLLLLEHIRSSNWMLGGLMDITDRLNVVRVGCHWNRNTLDVLRTAGFKFTQVHHMGPLQLFVEAHAVCI